MKDNLVKLGVIAILAIIVITSFLYFHYEKKLCDQAGGVLVKTVISFECVKVQRMP